MKQENEVKQASAKPVPTPQPQTAPRSRPAKAPSAPRRSFDLPSFGGGGALDPSSAMLAVVLACLAFAAYRCRP